MSGVDEAYWTDPAGKTHKVLVVERRKKTATIEYWDNTRRGDRYVNFRRYNHGTRARLIVYLTELRPVG